LGGHNLGQWASARVLGLELVAMNTDTIGKSLCPASGGLIPYLHLLWVIAIGHAGALQELFNRLWP